MKIAPVVSGLFAALAQVMTLAACATMGPRAPADSFFANLSALCGKAFEGQVVTTDAADADFAGKRLLMRVNDCSANEIRIPFSVGEDRSRTWVITRTTTGLRLKHDHRHADGTEDAVSQYGGDTTAPGTANRQEFPVDQYSIDLFTRENRTVSNTNVWAVEVHRGQMFAYELRRANRHFRVEFDLSKPVG
jgi:hypothetical protein